jgi:hypothetical protein
LRIKTRAPPHPSDTHFGPKRAGVLELFREFPEMPVRMIAERIGWQRGITILRDRVAELPPLLVLPDSCQRTSYRPDEFAQFDL